MPDINIFDSTKETPISLAEASQLLPPNRPCKRIAIATFSRWIRRGVRHGSGRVKLEGIRIGRQLYTSRESIHRFGERLSVPDSTNRKRTASEARRASMRAEKELDKAGF